MKYGLDNVITAKDIIIATGSVPFVPKGIEVDGILIFISNLFTDHQMICMVME